MTTTAPQPVSSPTVETPSQTSPSPTPGSHPGPGRKVLAGLAATLVVAGGIGAYFALNTSSTPASTPAPAKQTVTSGGVDIIERSGVGRSLSTDRPDVIERAVPTSATVTSGGVDVIERTAAAQTTTPGGVDVIERSGGKAGAESLTLSMATMYRGSTVTAESAAAASASHWANLTTQTSTDTQFAQWTASTRDGLASNDADYGSHWNNVTTGAAAVSQPVTSGGVDVIERQGCSVQCLAAQARLESRTG